MIQTLTPFPVLIFYYVDFPFFWKNILSDTFSELYLFNIRENIKKDYSYIDIVHLIVIDKCKKFVLFFTKKKPTSLD